MTDITQTQVNELSIFNGELTMTLKEITDLLEVRHNNAMRVVEEMVKQVEFGLATKIKQPITSGKGRKHI